MKINLNSTSSYPSGGGLEISITKTPPSDLANRLSRPLFPALRSGPVDVSGASRRKQIPGRKLRGSGMIPSSECTFVKILFCLILLPLSLIHGFAADLQLVGGDVKASLRVKFPDSPEQDFNQTVAITAAQLQPSYPSTTLLTSEGFRGTDYVSVAASLAKNEFRITQNARLQAPPFGREAEFVNRLQFLIPATSDQPAGTPVKVKVVAQGDSTNLFNGFGGYQGIALDSSGGLMAEYVVSTVDGRPASYGIRFAGQTLDLSSSTESMQLVGEVQTGTPFVVELDLLALAGGRGTLTGIDSNMTVSIVEKLTQTITFSPPSEIYAESTQLVAKATSGLPVTFTLVSGYASLTEGNLMPTGVDSITVRAMQAGNAQYDAAPPVERTIRVLSGLDIYAAWGVKSEGGNILNTTGENQVLSLPFAQGGYTMGGWQFVAKNNSPVARKYTFVADYSMSSKMRTSSTFYVHGVGPGGDLGDVTGQLESGVFQVDLKPGESVKFLGVFKYRGKYISNKRVATYPMISGTYFLRGFASDGTVGESDVSGILWKAERQTHNPIPNQRFRGLNQQTDRKFIRLRSQTVAIGVRG